MAEWHAVKASRSISGAKQLRVDGSAGKSPVLFETRTEESSSAPVYAFIADMGIPYRRVCVRR